MHQRRFAGAVVADEADAFAGADMKVDAVERTDGAEMFFDAVQSDDVGIRLDGMLDDIRVGDAGRQSCPRIT